MLMKSSKVDTFTAGNSNSMVRLEGFGVLSGTFSRTMGSAALEGLRGRERGLGWADEDCDAGPLESSGLRVRAN
jgi:hypothetical protein